MHLAGYLHAVTLCGHHTVFSNTLLKQVTYPKQVVLLQHVYGIMLSIPTYAFF